MNDIKIKNRTSGVNPRITADRIEKILAEAGALSVSRMYDSGEIIGFEFLIATPHGNINFRMPVDVERAYAVLYNEVDKKKRQHSWRSMTATQKQTIREQAARTAWKLSQEWIEIQLSMVRMQQAELVQVFMPYAVKNGVTLFDAMKRGGFTNLLSAPKGEITIDDE